MTRRYLSTIELRDALIDAVKTELPSLLRAAIEAHLKPHLTNSTSTHTDSFISRRDAANRLGVSVQTIAKLIADFELPCTRLGRRVLLSEADVQDLVNKRRIMQEPSRRSGS